MESYLGLINLTIYSGDWITFRNMVVGCLTEAQVLRKDKETNKKKKQSGEETDVCGIGFTKMELNQTLTVLVIICWNNGVDRS